MANCRLEVAPSRPPNRPLKEKARVFLLPMPRGMALAIYRPLARMGTQCRLLLSKALLLVITWYVTIVHPLSILKAKPIRLALFFPILNPRPREQNIPLALGPNNLTWIAFPIFPLDRPTSEVVTPVPLFMWIKWGTPGRSTNLPSVAVAVLTPLQLIPWARVKFTNPYWARSLGSIKETSILFPLPAWSRGQKNVALVKPLCTRTLFALVSLLESFTLIPLRVDALITLLRSITLAIVLRPTIVPVVSSFSTPKVFVRAV